MENFLIHVDSEPIEARPGDTVAAALLRAGVTTFTRSIKYHRPRGPFCLEGSCGQCLLRVDGVPSVQACRVPAAAGMRCERQNAPLGTVESDVFRAVDFLFASGMDHHHLVTFSRTAGQLALEVARRLAGLGHLPDRPLPARPGRGRQESVAIVGAGPAGLAAAAAAGEGAVVLERDAAPGGAALLGLDPALSGLAQIDELARAAQAAGAQLWLRSEVVGLYADEGRALLAVRGPEGLTALRADRVIVATGGISQPLPFAGVDRPGVYAARGLLRMARESGVLAGSPRVRPGPPGSGSESAGAPLLAVVGEGRELSLCAQALQKCGYEISIIVESQNIRRARGNPVRAVEVAGERGEVTRVRCDAVAIALPPAPLHELATSCGARAQWDEAAGGFPIEVDQGGRTAVEWLFAAGTAAGKPALESGRLAGEAARG